MNSILSPDDYYRPSRARELRRHAEALERRCFRLFALCLLFLALGTVGGVAVLAWSGGSGGSLLVGLLLLWLGALWFCVLNVRSLGRAERCRKEALALEREHSAKYDGPESRNQAGRSEEETCELPEHIQAEHRVDLLYWVLENRS